MKISPTSRRAAFTVLELLVVLGVVALLAALLLPALSTARERGRQTVCASNLRQLGQAIALYCSDWEKYPRGIDPVDKYTPQVWAGFPGAATIMSTTPLLNEVLHNYVKDQRLWQCPSDTGFDICDSTGLAMNARPTSFASYGMSYYYRTELMLREKASEDLPQAAKTHVLADGDGSWHGTRLINIWEGRRYNVLFADHHVKSMDGEKFDALWGIGVE